MDLPFFYEPHIAITNTMFSLGDETSKHVTQVMRMRTGDELKITDGAGNLFAATIVEPDKKQTTVRITSSGYIAAPQRKIFLGISLLKNNSRFEWFLEKATEIGVTGIIPLICRRTERQKFRLERMNKIVVAAMLQSEQAWLPILSEPENCETVLTLHANRKLIAHCGPAEKTNLADLPGEDDVLLLIGPEGDFDEAEIERAIQNGFQPVSLGSRRLRTETAGIVAATLLVNA